MIVRPVLCRPFIGRREELAYLNERRLEAGRSRGGLVLIEGDAGVGKSRLISEFCKSLAYSRWKIGSGACLEFASRPYGPIIEALSGAGGVPFTLTAAATKRDQFDEIIERLGAIASKRAVIVVVEDLHWADAATLDLLAYLGPKLQRMRVLVIVSVRGDELHSGRPLTASVAKIVRNARAGRIELGPLRGAELQSFIDEALGSIALPDETRRAIALAADGNPFFTEELLKSAVERGAGNEGGGYREVPQTVSSALLDRLRLFDTTQRQVIGQAAVIGRTFALDLLATTLQMEGDAVLPALRRARDVQLVEEVAPNLFRFRHGLTRKAIYGEFLNAELQPRHRTIALALETAPRESRNVEALAYHWWAAKDAAKAADYNELAGDTAAEIHAREDAIACYERALEFETNAFKRAAIVKKIADARLALGLTREAHATYGAAADAFGAAGDHEREAGCRASAAITGYGIGLPNPTAPLEAMLSRLGGDEYLAAARVRLGLAWLAATFGFPTRAAEHLDRVDPRALRVRELALRFHNVAAFVAMTLGDAETFRKKFADWVEAATATGNSSTVAGAYTNGAMGCAFFGWHEEAAQHIESALRAARDARSRHAEESAHAFAAMCCLLRGDLCAAREELEHVSPASENNVNITFATGWGSVVAAALDDQRLIQKWFDGFDERVTKAPEIECGGGFAEIMVRRGRAGDAAALLHRALPECELVRGNVITLLAVGRYGAPADRRHAREYLERATVGTIELVERPALLLFDAFECRREGREDEAVALARDAAQGFARLRFPLLEAQAREAAGELDAALALFRSCGATYDVRRLERTGGAGAPKVLSAREHEIALLAAGGCSNLEIARQLSITHKTVEKHLGSAYQKLHITSRAQLDDYVEAARHRVSS